MPKAVASLDPQRLAAACDLDVAVGAVEEPVGGQGRVVVALRVPDVAGDRVGRALERVRADDRGEQRGAHDPAGAGGVALVEGGDDAVRAVHPGEQVADRHAHALRRVGVGSGDGHEPGLALGDLVVARAPTLRTVVTEAADREHDETGVELVEPVVAEAEAVHDPRTEVLDEDVGALDEPGEHVAPVVGLEVEGDRLLVAVGAEEVRRDRVVLGPDEGRSPAPRVVTGGRLDLDDASTHVAQHHRGVRAGEGSGQVDDGDVLQRSGHAPSLGSGGALVIGQVVARRTPPGVTFCQLPRRMPSAHLGPPRRPAARTRRTSTRTAIPSARPDTAGERTEMSASPAAESAASVTG